MLKGIVAVLLAPMKHNTGKVLMVYAFRFVLALLLITPEIVGDAIQIHRL